MMVDDDETDQTMAELDASFNQLVRFVGWFAAGAVPSFLSGALVMLFTHGPTGRIPATKHRDTIIMSVVPAICGSASGYLQTFASNYLYALGGAVALQAMIAKTNI